MLSLDRVNSIFEESSIITVVSGTSDRGRNRTIADLNDVNRTRTIYFFFFPFFYFPSIESEFPVRVFPPPRRFSTFGDGQRRWTRTGTERGKPVRDRVLEQASKLIRLS